MSGSNGVSDDIKKITKYLSKFLFGCYSVNVWANGNTHLGICQTNSVEHHHRCLTERLWLV